ncbi:lysozyme [Acinetobacter phage SH-Ab 15497]|nr:lysozyme [Acinetobacter phage SH-Ab 15497]
MTMTTKRIFDHMRPNLTDSQVQALYKLMEKGADLDTIAQFAGVPAVVSTANMKKPSGFQFSQTSLKRLEGVNPKLVKVVRRALEISKEDFMVIEGVRTKEQCYINFGKGRSGAECLAAGVPSKYAQPNLAKVTWLKNPLNSKHVTGNAVDLAPIPLDWNDLKRFDQMAQAMFQASAELNIPIRWGADWDNDGVFREKGETDSPHFELVG